MSLVSYSFIDNNIRDNSTYNQCGCSKQDSIVINISCNGTSYKYNCS